MKPRHPLPSLLAGSNAIECYRLTWWQRLLRVLRLRRTQQISRRLPR